MFIINKSVVPPHTPLPTSVPTIWQLIIQTCLFICIFKKYTYTYNEKNSSACFGNKYIEVGMRQRIAWPLSKDNMQICEAFHILKNKENSNIKNIYLLSNFVNEFNLSFRITQKQYT